MAATADVSISLDPSAVFVAFNDYARLQQIRGKTSEATLKKLMKFWISFALFKIDAAKPADIEANLMRLTASYSRIQIRSRRRLSAKSKNRYGAAADRYRGTVAAAIVAALNYKGVKNAASAGGKRIVGDGTAFYATVRRFISARKYSAKLHKAGFYPTITALKIGSIGRLPKYRNTPGTYKENIQNFAAILVAENFASAADRPGRPAAGIAGLFPNCLSDAETEVGLQLEKWLAQDLRAAASAAGFHTAAAA